MDFDKTLKTLTETRNGDNLPLISDGRKENVYFLVDNDNRSKTTERQFTDDCGTWLKSSLKTHYLKSRLGHFEYIYKNQSIFFMRKNGLMVTLNPQPDLHSLVVLQRYHSKLKKIKIIREGLAGLKILRTMMVFNWYIFLNTLGTIRETYHMALLKI